MGKLIQWKSSITLRIHALADHAISTGSLGLFVLYSDFSAGVSKGLVLFPGR